MFKELSEDLNSIKKIQSEMKGTLIAIKNNLQGNNSRVDEVKNWNKRKKKKTYQNKKKKKNSKNEDCVRSLKHSNI